MRRIVLCLLLATLPACDKGRETRIADTAATATASATPAVERKVHVVQKGQFLIWIASQYNVGWEAMLLANEDFLREKYDEVCGELSRRFRNRSQDRGTQRGGLYYCNDRFNRPYGNTLRAGWELTIPTDIAPRSIDEIIENIEGESIALVIDDTGSMNDDRQTVANFYMASLRKYKKRLAGVWLYTDGEVRKYQAGSVRFLTDGEHENTYGALLEAADAKPDAIVLVTDEPGDDWAWGSVSDLPPVFSHCLDEGEYGCKANLERLAQETGGKYAAGLE